MKTTKKESKLDQNIEQKIAGLNFLLEIEEQARKAKNTKELGFIITNDTYKLVPYRQTALGLYKIDSIKVESVSGLPAVNDEAPYIKWLEEIMEFACTNFTLNDLYTLKASDFDSDLKKGWEEWCSTHVVWCPFRDIEGNVLGGMFIQVDSLPSEQEKEILTRLALAYSHEVMVQSFEVKKSIKLTLRKYSRSIYIYAIIILILIMAAPVEQTVLAPMEVIPKDPWIASTPQQGVVKTIHVEPNQKVKPGDLLFSLDDTKLRNELEFAKKSLELAITDLKVARQQTFLDDAQRAAEVQLLRVTVEQRKNEISYTTELLNNIHIKSEISGVVVLNDKDDWLGKPVQVGERVMTIADPNHVEVLARLPAEDAINIPENGKMKVFLNSNPLKNINATVKYMSYEAEVNDSEILSYRVKGSFKDLDEIPRIGMQGTAKLHGEDVSLFYYLFRKPITYLKEFKIG